MFKLHVSSVILIAIFIIIVGLNDLLVWAIKVATILDAR